MNGEKFLMCCVWMCYGVALGMMLGYKQYCFIPIFIGLIISVTALIMKHSNKNEV